MEDRQLLKERKDAIEPTGGKGHEISDLDYP
jgi:hypothetical protein